MSLSYCVGLVYRHAVLVVRGGGELSDDVEADALVKFSVKCSNHYNCMSINKPLYNSKESCMVWHIRKRHTAYGFALLYFLACQRPWPNTISSRIKVTRCTYGNAYGLHMFISTQHCGSTWCVLCTPILFAVITCVFHFHSITHSKLLYAYIKVNIKCLQTFLYNND